jgi:hypothetical protein
MGSCKKSARRGQEDGDMATLNQAIVSGVLTTLKLESVPANPPIMGGPQEWEVTKETVDFIKSMEGKSFVVNSDGEMTQK